MVALLNPMDSQTKLVIESHDLRQTIRKSSRLAEEFWQPAIGECQAVSRIRKDRRNLRIQSLGHAEADRFQSRRRKTGTASRIYDLDRAIEDVKARGDITNNQ